MGKLDVTLERRAPLSWFALTMAVSTCVLVGLAESGASASGASGIALRLAVSCFVVLMVALVAFAFEERSVYLIDSSPPTIVRSGRWFRLISHTTRVSIPDLLWVRVTYAEEMKLAVELVTSSQQTTVVACISYSGEGIAAANALCTRISQFLHIEDKGYRPYA